MDDWEKEVLLEMISSWTPEQLEDYINRQQERMAHLNDRVKFVRGIIRTLKNKRKKPVDTGARDGR